MTFVQRGEQVPIGEVQCYNCQEMGHYAQRCRNAYVPRDRSQITPANSVQLLQESEIEQMNEYTGDAASDEDMNFSFAQTTPDGPAQVVTSTSHKVNQNWVLLDSESTVNIFSNRKFLKNIPTAETNTVFAFTQTAAHKTRT
jgi:Zinc knuckle